MPVETVSVWPACAVPVIAGSAVFAGFAAAATAEVWLEVAEPVPAVFVAETTTRIVAPTSAAAST